MAAVQRLQQARQALSLESAIEKLEQACELDPGNDEYSVALEALYRAADRLAHEVGFNPERPDLGLRD